jgi:hypothetical protein
MTDVVVTGLPRAGTTLLCALIDSLEDAVCLNSPRRHNRLATLLPGPLPFSKWLAGDYLWTRLQLLQQDPIKDFRAADGSPLLDTMHDPRMIRNESGEPETMIFVRPGLSQDFLFGM